jgi:Arc/MetJ-type ribon-helix-helix transcriptional regulator
MSKRIVTIHLPKKVGSSIRKAVQSGQFASIDEAMTEAARLLLEKAQRAEHSKARTEDEVLRQMLADGLITQLPDRDADVDGEDDEPVVIEGEPLSETIIRNRR